MPWLKIYVARMLTRSLFAVANFLVLFCNVLEDTVVKIGLNISVKVKDTKKRLMALETLN